jgi:hypothetical protein
MTSALARLTRPSYRYSSAEGDFGVKSAVDEYFGRRGIRVQSTLQDEPWVTWVVDVPEPGRKQAPRALEVAARAGVSAARRVRRARPGRR